ncbi:monocarboxylate transporter 14 isoform X2 [Cimex lectularius]|nr:monocarboxylate transporter 14 isoform X2 [Cimex lectularius]
MILSCFATSIIYLYFSFGVMVGFGAGLSFPPGIYLVTNYFVKYRGFANGLAISGSAIGSIIFPPFIRFLLEKYGYRGSVLIMGGLTFNVIVGALVYHPVSQHMKRVRVRKDPAIESKLNGADEKSVVDVSPTSPERNGDTVIMMKSNSKVDQESEQPLLTASEHRKLSSGTGFKKSLVNLDSVPSVRKVSSSSYAGRMYNIGSSGQINRKISTYATPMSVGSTGQMSRNYSVASNMSGSSFRYVSTAFHGSTLVGLHPEYSSNLNMKKTKQTSWFSCCTKSPEKTKKEITEEKPSVIKTLLSNPMFIIILISNATNAIGYVNFTILVPTYAISMGFDKSKASYLLSIIASTDLVGRIGGAALSDILKVDKRIYFVGGYLMSGIALVTLPLAMSYTNVGILCAMFGLASGTYVGITTVIMVDMLGEEMLASSYGTSLFVNGILQLIGPPICGVLFQQLNAYAPIISGLGVTLIIGAAVWGLVPFIKQK